MKCTAVSLNTEKFTYFIQYYTFPHRHIGISLPTGVSPPHVEEGDAVTLSQLFANEFISLSPLLLTQF
jgi:hypothetical protein